MNTKERAFSKLPTSEQAALYSAAENGSLGAAKALPMSELAERRRGNMTARTIAANHGLHLRSICPTHGDVSGLFTYLGRICGVCGESAKAQVD